MRKYSKVLGVVEGPPEEVMLVLNSEGQIDFSKKIKVKE